MEIEHRSIPAIRLDLAIARERLAAYDHDEDHTGDHDYFVACNRVQTFEDELYLAEAYAQAMAEQVAQKWIYRYAPASTPVQIQN
ncbi:hypothetical protein H4CHR_02960 [Variovorax sp. PBS-H4]|uniref:hypothetical protein n=1 Tax=Variovorax sp. PBS-H4 TaxID=434008 RepID=UPI001316D87D|nr:hypothetical protein [Variovorax sp. PBS-H4]VTU32185.1 hypothetical protein H4CHR_02960 [Variovorax sp. PBS-H4]